MRTIQARKTGKRTRKRSSRALSPNVERYTPRRLAQFLLENAVGAAGDAAARREVRKLGVKILRPREYLALRASA